MKKSQLRNLIRESIKEITNKKPLLEQGPPMSPEGINPGTFNYYNGLVQAGSGDITNDSGCYITLNGAHYLLKNGVIARPNGTPLTYNGGLATPAGDYGGCQPSHLAMEAIPTHVDQILNPEITPLTDFNQAGFPLVSDSVYGNPPSSVQPNSSFTTNQTFYNADEAVAFTTSPDFPNFDNQPQPIPNSNFLVVRYFEGYKSPEVEPEPVEPETIVTGSGFVTGSQEPAETDFDPDFTPSDMFGDDFPQGFNPNQWAQGWLQNLLSFLNFDTLPIDTLNVCPFLADRIELWTNQYQTAGPLYQNQLVFKIQVAYMAQDIFDCSGAPSDEYNILPQALSEQIIPSKPSSSRLRNLIDKLAKDLRKMVQSRMPKATPEKAPAIDRMQKLAGISKDEPMDKPEEK